MELRNLPAQSKDINEPKRERISDIYKKAARGSILDLQIASMQTTKKRRITTMGKIVSVGEFLNQNESPGSLANQIRRSTSKISRLRLTTQEMNEIPAFLRPMRTLS